MIGFLRSGSCGLRSVSTWMFSLVTFMQPHAATSWIGLPRCECEITASGPTDRPTHPYGPGSGRNATRFLSKTPAAPDAFEFQPQKAITCTLVRGKIQLESYALPNCRREKLFRGTKVSVHQSKGLRRPCMKPFSRSRAREAQQLVHSKHPTRYT